MALSALLLDFSRKISMMDQGDYPRSIGFLLGSPLDQVPYVGRAHPAFLWPYLAHITNPLLQYNSASVYFWLAGKIQSLIQPNFDVYLVGFLSKTAVLFCCFRIARRWSSPARYIVLLTLAIAFFYAHNIAFLNSLYPEHAFVVGMALLLAGAFEPVRIMRLFLIAAGLLLSAASKPQFFYLPALFIAASVTVDLTRRRRLHIWILSILVVVQAISIVPLVEASTKQVN